MFFYNKNQNMIRDAQKRNNFWRIDKLLRTYNVTETNPVLVDISDLSKGVYFITLDGKSVKLIKE